MKVGRIDFPGSAFLQQISDLKHRIDQIDNQIEAQINSTREVESAIVACSEKEQTLLCEINEIQLTIFRRESQYSDLLALAGVKQKRVADLEGKIRHMENRRDELCLEIEEERNAFIASCKNFQQEMGDRPDDSYALVPSKAKNSTDVDLLKKDIEGVQLTDEATNRSKTERLRPNVHGELQNEVDLENVQNEHLLRRIEGLNQALVNIPGCQEIARLEGDFDQFSEETRNLENGVVTLQSQLPLLFSQEQKLSNLLKDQQRALESLERKIEEVKLLQEAYDNDFRDQLDEETSVQPRQGPCPPQGSTLIGAPTLAGGGTQPPSGMWGTIASQPGKRHRLG